MLELSRTQKMLAEKIIRDMIIYGDGYYKSVDGRIDYIPVNKVYRKMNLWEWLKFMFRKIKRWYRKCLNR